MKKEETGCLALCSEIERRPAPGTSLCCHLHLRSLLRSSRPVCCSTPSNTHPSFIHASCFSLQVGWMVGCERWCKHQAASLPGLPSRRTVRRWLRCVDILRPYITAADTSRSRAALIGEGGPVIYCDWTSESRERESPDSQDV